MSDLLEFLKSSPPAEGMQLIAIIAACGALKAGLDIWRHRG